MKRIGFFAVVAFVLAIGLTQAQEKPFRFQGTLTKDDPIDKDRQGPSQFHVVKLKAGRMYTIDMVSSDVDSYLRLFDGKMNQLAEDDDSGGNLNARIGFNCTQDGDYKIICTTYRANAYGAYTLTVTSAGMAQQPSTPHAKMIGNPAPDFAADFAAVGKAVKIADLKGQVVLLDFRDLRSPQCNALLPKLRDWHKAHKADGLAIVSLTFYGVDINQKLTLDKETGNVVPTKKADRASDQALLRAFAAHHKIDHVLLALPKQAAFDAFNAYVVNGVPQLVLIDRKGMVRLIDLGSEKSSAILETELKKLLAEK